MNITVKSNTGVAVLSISGRLDAVSAPLLKKEFTNLLKDNRHFVFDMAGMDFVDSTGLGSIVGCLKSAVESDGNIKLLHLQEKPRMVFEITRAYKIFEIFDDLDTAIKSYR